MPNLFKEFRRREVFRTVGLYIGIAWIVIEGASVLLPAFDAPEWTLRALIIVAIIGLPVVTVLAWVFDITESGIHVQAEATDTVVIPFGGRKTDFVVIGVLSVALVFSVYLIVTGNRSAIVAAVEPVSVLIADFDNQTGDALFDGSLEQALNLGIEGASFVTSYRRPRALSQAQALEYGQVLDEAVARLIAIREGISIVLAGSIQPDGERYLLHLKAIDSRGEVRAEIDAKAASKSEVLAAVNVLAAEMRRELGDTSRAVDQLAAGEAVTVTSLEALKDYVTAQDLARAGQDEDAIAYYREAIDKDPNFARAYSGWGLSAFKIGRRSEAAEQWQKALSLLDRMTERERYRTLGLYYTAMSLNYEKAIENYAQLVEKFPADSAGLNNLSVLYFLNLQFDEAVEESGRLIQIYPARTLYQSNHALNAMWAGDLDTAVTAAELVIAEDPTAFKPYIVLAMAALERGDVEGARAAYRSMMATGPRGESRGVTGLADLALFEGDPGGAEALLTEGIKSDRELNNERDIAAKLIALAQSYAAQGADDRAISTLRSLGDGDRREGQLIPAAEIYVSLGDFEAALAIAEEFESQLRPQARAYARLIRGMVALEQQQYVLAIDEINAALDYADLWIVRYYLGLAYLSAGYPAEAASEFEAAAGRRGEAMAMFFDDVPTWRYTGRLQTGIEEVRRTLSELSGHRKSY